jgi:hypothetical protein
MSTREASPWQPSPSGGFGAATAVVPVLRTDRPERDVGGRPASPRPLAIRSASTRLLAPLVGVLALTLAVAGRGGGGTSKGVASLGGKAAATTSPGASSDPEQAALAHARCMRQHGINTPDPKITADGVVHPPPHVEQPTRQKSPKLRAAEQACQQYLSNGGQARKPNAQEQQQMVAFARCMRQHGVNVPDPQITADGPELRYPRGVDPDDPRLKAAERGCQRYLPDMLGP